MKTLHTRRWIVLAALLALVLAVALCACSGGQEPSREMDTPVETATPTPTPTATPEPTATPTPTPTPTPEPTAEPTPEATPEPTDDNAELVALKNGEVNDNGNLTSSANGNGNGKTEGNSASTKKPNASVVEGPNFVEQPPVNNQSNDTSGRPPKPNDGNNWVWNDLLGWIQEGGEPPYCGEVETDGLTAEEHIQIALDPNAAHYGEVG